MEFAVTAFVNVKRRFPKTHSTWKCRPSCKHEPAESFVVGASVICQDTLSFYLQSLGIDHLTTLAQSSVGFFNKTIFVELGASASLPLP